MNALEVIRRRMKERDTLVCAGIDPNLERMPEEIRSLKASDEEKVFVFLKDYVDVVAPHVCAFKAQKAYFDVFDGGHALLKEVIAYVHEKHGIPVILDCKIGDIDETMKAYCKNVFDVLQADGVVVNPYMGDDVMLPLAAYADKAIVPLVKTSNPGAAVVQDVMGKDGSPLWETVLKLVMQRWNASKNMVPVIASTQKMDLRAVRAMIGDETLALFAGMGAQGGSSNALGDLLNAQKAGVFVNSSRGLMYPAVKEGETWKEAVARAVVGLKEELNAQRR